MPVFRDLSAFAKFYQLKKCNLNIIKILQLYNYILVHSSWAHLKPKIEKRKSLYKKLTCLEWTICILFR